MTVNRSKAKQKFTRSRSGCHNCKQMKMRCSEDKPKCTQCKKLGISCDYSLKLRWGRYDVCNSEVVAPVKQSNKVFSFINVPMKRSKQHVQNQTTPEDTLVKPSPEEHLELITTDYYNIEEIIRNLSPVILTPEEKEDHLDGEVFTLTRSLNCLPDILLNDVYYYDSFMFFCDQTSKILVCAPNDIYIENPYQKLLPKLAVANDSVLCLLLSFGICHKSTVCNEERPVEIIENLKKRSIKSLELLLEDDSESSKEMVLAIVICLGSFEIFSASGAGDWKKHVKFAKKILSKRGIKFYSIYERFKSCSDSSAESDLFLFLFRWLAYIDVIGCLASPLISDDVPSESSLYSISTDDYDHFINSSETILDPLLGFDIRLLPAFDKIANLVSLNGNDESIPMLTVTEALCLEKSILNIKNQALQKDGMESSLYSTNSIFCLTSLLILYRRVLKVDRNSHVIRNICTQIKIEFEDGLTPGSSAEICSMFSIFTASVEAVDDDLREFFTRRLSKLISLGDTVVGNQALRVIHNTWNTGKEWTEAAREILTGDVAFI